MIKKFRILFLLLILMMTFNVKAEELTPVIKETWISGMTEKKVGETLSLSFAAKVDGIEKNNGNSYGILVVSYELIFDDTVFTVTGIESETDTWDSVIYEEDGKYFVLSTVTDTNRSQNKCVDGISYCSDYIVSINFFVNNTDKQSSIIKMGELAIGLSKMINPNEEVTDDDIKTISSSDNDSYTIKIIKPENIVSEKPNSIVSDKKPSVSTKTIISKTKKETPIEKSDNKFLKSLEIENYVIEFDKLKERYEILIEKDVNELKLNVELEDQKATYEIIGNDDLAKNDYKVSIKVTAENGDTKMYTIDVKVKMDNIVSEDKEDETSKVNKNYLMIIGIIVGIILLILIIIKIIKFCSDKKIDKAINKF